MTIFLDRFSSEYDKASFDCGVPELNDYLHKYAKQDENRHLARVFVLVEDKRIIGYFTLSMQSFEVQNLPEHIKKKLPLNRKVPCALLGRLAVSTSHKGQRLGLTLLKQAIVRTASVNEVVAAFGLIVDAKNETVKQFYEKYGFVAFTDDAMRLILPMKEILSLIDIWKKDIPSDR